MIYFLTLLSTIASLFIADSAYARGNGCLVCKCEDGEKTNIYATGPTDWYTRCSKYCDSHEGKSEGDGGSCS